MFNHYSHLSIDWQAFESHSQIVSQFLTVCRLSKFSHMFINTCIDIRVNIHKKAFWVSSVVEEMLTRVVCYWHKLATRQYVDNKRWRVVWERLPALQEECISKSPYPERNFFFVFVFLCIFLLEKMKRKKFR